MRSVVAAISVVASVLLPVVAVGGEPDSGTIEQFAHRLVGAINSQSPVRRWDGIHSASRACVTPESRLYIENMFARQSRDSIPSNYRISVEVVPLDKPLMFESDVVYPVRPTHGLKIDFETESNRGRLIFIYVARDRSAWREVLACPRPQTAMRTKAKAQESSATELKAQRLARAIPESLRASLLEFLRQGRRLDAIKAYASATHEDLATSRRVVELLASQSR